MKAPRVLDLDGAADAISGWGFLAGGRQLGDPRPGYLLIAIRRHTTLDHFDPETVRFWVSEDGASMRYDLDLRSRLPWEHDLSWGEISVFDRMRVHNDWFTFGGVVTAGRTDDTVVVVFLSPAPLLRAGGHSQGRDTGADAVGAFFGRIRAAAGVRRDLERKITRTDPLTLYATFVCDELARTAPALGAIDEDRELRAVLRAERSRLAGSDPSRLAAAEALARAVAAASRRDAGT
jgi:hypothetical protein